MKALITVTMLAATVGFNSTIAAADPIKERKEIMKTYKDAVSLASKMTKGSEPFDAAKLAEAMNGMASTADKFLTLFPEGSEPDPKSDSKYYATDDVWLKPDDFKTKSDDLKKTVTAAAAADSVDSLKVALKDVFGSCKGCHETYRAKR